jgi:hypothetical protein
VKKAEKAWLDASVRLGCIVCRLQGLGATPAEPHHLLLKSGRRMGHLFTIPLCPAHHRGQRNDEGCTSRHPYRAQFEARYGTEAVLLERTRELVGAP